LIVKLDVVLKRLGATLVSADTKGQQTTLLIRASRDRRDAARWKVVIEEVLLASTETRNKGWSADVSKVFFAQDGAVKYLWRIIVKGELRKGLEAFGNAAIRSLSTGSEVTSIGLVGRKQYEFDPAAGKMKGAHDPKAARRAISVGLSKGSIQ
jgi:hypothetical protein